MLTRSFLAELLVAILTVYPALANSLILLSSSPSCLPNITCMRFSYRVRANGWMVSMVFLGSSLHASVIRLSGDMNRRKVLIFRKRFRTGFMRGSVCMST
jgi:hypothetical protein